MKAVTNLTSYLSSYFTDIGVKIKQMAKRSFYFFIIIEAIAAAVCGVVAIVGGSFLFGLLMTFFGPFAAILINTTFGAPFYMLIYGFGELVDKAIHIESAISSSDSSDVNSKTKTQSDEKKKAKLKKLHEKGFIPEKVYQDMLNSADSENSDELPTL